MGRTSFHDRQQTFDFRHHRKPTLTSTAIMADEYDAVEAAEIKKKRAFRKFSYRGIDLDQYASHTYTYIP